MGLMNLLSVSYGHYIIKKSIHVITQCMVALYIYIYITKSDLPLILLYCTHAYMLMIAIAIIFIIIYYTIKNYTCTT